MCSNASALATCHAFMFLESIILRAMRFHPRGELSTQNFPISVWSGVRVVLLNLPRLLISLKSAVYAALVIGSGGPGMNCAPEVIPNGVTVPHPGESYNPLKGGV